MKNFIQTYSGLAFHPIRPDPRLVRLTDIAHALSHQCRFSGHTKRFYSVAEHSVRVSLACDPEDALWGLLHDASEAYLVDVPSPVKRALGMEPYRQWESWVQGAVCERFQLPKRMPPSVHEADLVLLATEARDLMLPVAGHWDGLPEPLAEVIRPWTSEQAKIRFLKRASELLRIRNREMEMKRTKELGL